MTPTVPTLSYTRLNIWNGPWSELGVPSPYGGGQPTQGTASLSTNDKDKSLETGTSGVANGKASTDETFNDTDVSGETAGVSNSGSGSSSTPAGNVSWQNSYNGSETESETDKNGGTIDNGVTTDGYNDYGTQTDTIASSTSYSGAGGSGSGPGGSGSTNYNGTDTTIVRETGGYTTAAAGGPAPKSSPDNPNGYATNNQSIRHVEIMSSSLTQKANASLSSPTFSEGVTSVYTAKDGFVAFSSSGVNVNVAQGIDTQSGGYLTSAWESQTAHFTDQGNWNYANFQIGSFNFLDDQAHSGYAIELGSYRGSENNTQGSSSSTNGSFTETITNYDPTTGQMGPPSVTSKATNIGSGPQSTTTTGQAGGAPVDGAVGGAPAAHSAVIIFLPQHPYNSAPFDRGKGTVSIIGIVGRDETPTTGEAGGLKGGGPTSGIEADVKAVKEHIEGEGAMGRDRLAASVNVPDPKVRGGQRPVGPVGIYGSSDGTPFPPLLGGAGTVKSRDETQIANDQLALIKANVNNLAEGEIHRVVIIGFSWGGAKAIRVARILSDLLKSNGLAEKVQIHLRTMDAAGQAGFPFKKHIPAGAVDSWHNWSQNRVAGDGDIPGLGDGANHDGNLLPAVAELPVSGAARHRALPAAALQELLRSLWTDIP